MTGCSMAAKRMGNDLITGKKKISDVSNSMKTATVSTKALGVAMNVFANVGFMLAITAVTKVVTELAQAQSKAVEVAHEATESYKEELVSLEDYKTKISELHEELSSENISYKDSKTIREELLTLQDELIKKYGNEKTAIENITTAIKGEVNALDELNEKAYRDWIAKADKRSGWNKLLPWGQSGLDQAIDYMETEKTVSFFDMSNANSMTQDKYQAPITDEIRSIQEEIDKTIQSKYNLEKEFATFKLTGTPEEIKSQLEAIRQDYLDLSKEAFLKNGISSKYWEAYRSEAINSINEVINKFDDGLKKHQETYQTYIEGMIKYDSEYSDEYANILQKRAALEYAENSGNDDDIRKARQEFMDAINNGIQASDSDENIKKYFESLYPELQAEFANWNFEVAINANTDELADKAKEIGEKYSANDLLDMVNTEGTQEGEESFNKLIDKAIEYGVCTDKSAEEVQKLIDLLVELGIVQDNVQGSTSSDKTDILNLSDYLNQSDLEKTKESLLELAKAGEIDENTFNSTEEYRTILSKLGISSKEAARQLKQMADLEMDMSDWQTQLSNARSSISELEGILDEINGEGISASSVDKITSDYPQLLKYLGDTPTLIKEINSLIDEQSEKAQNAGNMLIEYNADAYNQIKYTTQDAFDQIEVMQNGQIGSLAEMYGIDLNNYSSLAQAKKEIEFALLGSLDEGWAKHFGIVIDSLTGMAKVTQDLGGFYADPEAQSRLAAYNELITQLNSAKSKFENNVNYGTVDNSNKSSSDKWLQEYKDAMSILKDQLDQGLITQTQFYKESQELMDKYLKDTPAHVKKYATEISEAEKDIRNGLTSMFEGIISDINSDLDNMQSSFSSIANAIEEYNESGALSIDTVQELLKLEPKYLSMLFDENGALQLNQESYERLARAKMEEMKIGLAMEMANTINNLETEAQAIEFVTQMNKELINSNLAVAESYLQMAVAAAKARSERTGNAIFSQAADMGLQAYQNQARLIDMTSYSFSSLSGSSSSSKTEEKDPKTIDWIEKILNRLSNKLQKASNVISKMSDKTEKLISTVDNFLSWQKKNSMINRAIESSNKELVENQKQLANFTDAIKEVKNAINSYTEKLNSIELSDEYKDKIKNGTLEIEDIKDENLQNTIDQYEEWYDKIEDCKEEMNEYTDSIQETRDAISELFDQQRELIRQKLDNVLDYYDDMDSYLSSITAKVESLISLNDQMGKRSSLTELVEQFASLNQQMDSVTSNGNTAEVVKQQIASGTAESVQKAVADEKVKEAERIKKEIDGLNVEQSGTYKNLLKNIEKTYAQIALYEEKGWDETKLNQYNKLQKKLENYYAQQEALENDATANTVANYSKVFIAWQKLMDNTTYQKLLDKESDGILTDKEQAKLDKYNQQLANYEDQMNKIKEDGQAEIDALLSELSVLNGTAENTTEVEKIKQQINDVGDLYDTAIYQKLLSDIESVESKLFDLDMIGYDNLTKKQKTTYDKLTATLESYYKRKEALDEGATASNIAEYNKIYLAWRKLQDKLDAGKNLSIEEWQSYNSYTKKLETWVNDKAAQYEELNSKLNDALNPPDKKGVITKEYEEASKQMYDSYQKQIDAINDEVKNTQNYKTLLANIKSLEKKKGTKGLSKTEEDKLKKYKAELEALEKGGTATNVAEYMKTWEEWYKLQQKLDNGKKLSASEASKYDKYKAKLEAWNNEKQTQINDLLSQMEDDLEKLNKTYTENVSEAESEIDEYYANLYDLAKQIAEYNINALEQQLSVIRSMISYYQNLVGLYETFSGDKLSRLLIDLDEDTALSKLEIYQKQLSYLNEEYDVTKSKIKEYQQLLDALDTNDFASSMALFEQVMNDDSVSQATKDNLKQVIDLLNERAESADNWEEYADQWESEWSQALSEAKQSLIEVAGSIQEVNDAIRETSLEPLTDAITQLGYLKDTLSSITNLINDDWIFDDEGNLTEYGNAKVSLLVEQMQTARNEADKYAQQIDAIMSMRDTYSSEDAYQTALHEAKQNYLNSLNELKGFEDSVVSIMTQSNEAIVESLKDVISARINALKAQKDLYEYNKSITNSQKEIDNIKAQIDALENLSDATDAATKAKLAQLKADLEEKETALQETKDDHTYNLQIDALDEFMNKLDETMSNAADAVNKSFETYKEAIDSALKVYEENKDYLGEWSDTIMKNILGFVDGRGNTVDLDIGQSGSGESGSAIPAIKVENSDTASVVETQSETLHGDLIDIRTAIEQGIIVKVDSPLATMNPDMMNFMRDYVPPMANIVNTTLPQIAERNNTQTVVNVHYDNLLNVEGNVDKDFAKVLPKHLEEAYQYTTKKLYRELNILK